MSDSYSSLSSDHRRGGGGKKKRHGKRHGGKRGGRRRRGRSGSSSGDGKTRRALIIGGTGFISQFTVEALVKAGWDVTIVTRGVTPDQHGDTVERMVVDREKDKRGFVAKLRESAGRKRGERWDLAVDFISFDADDVKTCVKGLAGRVELFVQISTDSVYEVCVPSERSKVREDDDQLRDLSERKLMRLDDYGYGKWKAEEALREANFEMRFPFVALRLPDVLGEREVPSSRHYAYQELVMDRKTIDLGRDAKKKLSMVYAGDVARFILVLVDEDPEDVVGKAFNLGSVETPTLEEYVEMIGDFLETSVTFNHSSGKHQYFPSVECGPIDMSASMGVGGWTPTPLEDWLRPAVLWYADNRDKMVSSSSSSSSGSSSGASSSS